MYLDFLKHKRPTGKKTLFAAPNYPGMPPIQVIDIDHLGAFETCTPKNRHLLAGQGFIEMHVFSYNMQKYAFQFYTQNIVLFIKIG